MGTGATLTDVKEMTARDTGWPGRLAFDATKWLSPRAAPRPAPHMASGMERLLARRRQVAAWPHRPPGN
jgi:hypothetical protein